MSTPDVTVVVATYNTMPYLAETLDSLVSQSIGQERLEVVAVDDGSSDGSGQLLDESAERPVTTPLNGRRSAETKSAA